MLELPHTRCVATFSNRADWRRVCFAPFCRFTTPFSSNSDLRNFAPKPSERALLTLQSALARQFSLTIPGRFCRNAGRTADDGMHPRCAPAENWRRLALNMDTTSKSKVVSMCARNGAGDDEQACYPEEPVRAPDQRECAIGIAAELFGKSPVQEKRLCHEQHDSEDRPYRDHRVHPPVCDA